MEKSFGDDVDYAQLVKMFGKSPGSSAGRYGPAEWTGIKKIRITGNPEYNKVSTSYVERQNLTMRMHMRRFTRLNNGFGKKLENQLHAVSLHMYYNFAKIHKTLRVTPAMQAGLSDHVWSIEEIARLVPEPIAKKRGKYNSKTNNEK